MSLFTQEKFKTFIESELTEKEKDIAYICANFEFSFQTIGEYELGMYIAPYNVTVLSVTWYLLDKYGWSKRLTSHYSKNIISKIKIIVDQRILDIKAIAGDDNVRN
jgi:hypothetical protein